MHSVAPDNSGSPKKRTLSRGMSEDESLRSIIKESDSSSRRLTRSDSRAGTVKRRSDSQQSEQDLFMGLPEMLELQASYDEVVQELRGLEVEREALLFQVDVLQDTLEGVEELLAEAQREAGQASLELNQEREAKKKLESMVRSLMQDVERLKKERSPDPCLENVDGAARHQTTNGSRKPQAPDEVEGGAKGAEGDEGAVAKVRRVVTKPLGHFPSLALDNPFAEDGVHRRPYENGTESGRDSSPDRNDSDSISAYEDASAETPEQDGIFPGGADCPELPDDSTKEGSAIDHGPQDPKNPEGCIVS